MLAEEYFAQHGAELLNEAATTVERLLVEGYLGKRAQAVRNPPQLPAPPIQNPLRSARQNSNKINGRFPTKRRIQIRLIVDEPKPREPQDKEKADSE